MHLPPMHLTFHDFRPYCMHGGASRCVCGILSHLTACFCGRVCTDTVLLACSHMSYIQFLPPPRDREAVRCGAVVQLLTCLLPPSLLLAGQHALLIGAVARAADRSAPAVEGGRGGRRRSCDRNDRGVGLSPGARNTILDSRLDVKSCSRHATPTGGSITRGEALICTTDEHSGRRAADLALVTRRWCR